jgi:outer membrane immunogenic protein
VQACYLKIVIKKIMLKKFKFIVIAAALFVTCTGQIARAQIMAGPFIGFNLSTITGDSSSGRNYKPGFNVGGAIDFGLSSHLLLETGLTFNTKGTSFDQKGSFESGGFTANYENKGNTTYYYVGVPILIMLKADNGFFIQAGPDFSALLGASNSYTRTVNLNGSSTMTNTSSSSTNDLHTIDYGLNIGVGVQTKAGPFIRLGTVIGLGNIDNASDTNLTAHNLLFQLSVGFKFGA